MDDNLYQDDFEEFLQDQVGNQRMYPSDAVWRNISRELHGENRWPALTISAFVLLMATVGVCIHFSPKPNIFAVPASYAKADVKQDNNIAGFSSPSFLRTDKNNSTTSDNLKQVTSNNTSAARTDVAANSAKLINLNTTVKRTTNNGSPVKVVSIVQLPSSQLNVVNLTTDADPVTSLNNSASTATVLQAGTNPVLPPATKPVTDYSDENMVDNFLKEHKKDISLYTTTQVKSLKKRFSYVVYVAPSVSYRKLHEDRSAIKDNTGSGGGPVALNYVTDVNKIVRHKPGTGIEAGFGIIYNLSNKVRIRSGLQFNIRQYNIEAYRSSVEPASIALVTAAGIDSINTFSIYRTNNGYGSAELVNRYYQIAAPLGIEWEIIGNKNLQLNIAGNIQPTYLLNKNAYLLSTNYKNYTESKGMINSWNLNSNIEAFLSFKVGDFKWQLGPQLRYQHFSTYISPYPIKEHLMDYGFKLGVSKVIL